MYFSAPCLFAPDYGVFAVTCRTLKWEGTRRSVVHFWPGRSSADQSLDVGQAYFYEHSDIIHQIAVGVSGTYALILVLKADYRDDETYLGEGDGYVGLLHFSPTPTPHISFRRLDTGGKLICDQMLLDESLGLVVFAYSTGRETQEVTALSYA